MTFCLCLPPRTDNISSLIGQVYLALVFRVTMNALAEYAFRQGRINV